MIAAAEKALIIHLERFPLGVRPVYQAKEGPYTLDFFFREWRLAVELDGPRHDQYRDRQKDDTLAHAGIAVLRLPASFTPEKMREHIAYVAGRVKFMAIADRLQFVRSYRVSILDAIVEQATAPADKPSPRENCLDCAGSGWKMVPWWNPLYRAAEPRATRCDCTNVRVEVFELEAEPAPLFYRPQQCELFAPPKPPQQAGINFIPARQAG